LSECGRGWAIPSKEGEKPGERCGPRCSIISAWGTAGCRSGRSSVGEYRQRDPTRTCMLIARSEHDEPIDIANRRSIVYRSLQYSLELSD
jgi:hypothetical protein